MIPASTVYVKETFKSPLMGRMNKFTLLRAFAMGVGGKDYETEDQDRYLICLIMCF